MFNFGATIRPESPLRAVKKSRGAMGEQVVRDWDMRGSPRTRRIVTRSNRDAVEENLVELADEEDVEGSEVVEGETSREEVLRVEFEHEDGTILELDAEEGEAEEENENWDDESMTEEAVWDATLMHLAGIGEADGEGGSEQQNDEEQSHAQDEEMEMEENVHDAISNQEQTTLAEPSIPEVISQDPKSPAKHPEHAPQVQENEQLDGGEQGQEEVTAEATKTGKAPPTPQLKSALKQTSQFGAIPEGFVSPVKKRERRTINQVRLSNANRRRTLPVNFAAQHPAVTPISVKEEVVEEEPEEEAEPSLIHVSKDDNLSTVEPADELLVLPSESVAESVIQAALDEEDSDVELGILPHDNEAVASKKAHIDDTHDENAWEDVDENVPEESVDVEMEADSTQQQQPDVEVAPSDVLPSREDEHQVEEEEKMVVSEDSAPRSPTKQDVSPVGSIAGPHPRLPLRRSPRRQSTSPVRRNATLPSSRSHLVAFTPIKLPVYSSSNGLQSSPLPTAENQDSMHIDNPTPLPQLTRSSSAPPEEPQMSPRRPKQPRISDDTALLQAFLNRAAESKTSKDSTITAKRDSMENRRDSNAVRQALASPAPPTKAVAGDVLADLDPNSPSPRKQALAASLAEAAQSSGKAADDQDEDELASGTPTKRTSARKSGRVKKKTQVLSANTYSSSSGTSAGPNRIAIRSADSVVVLKKTEAQEIAQMTRTNTKKNKSGAVLPPMRLTRLAAEKLARVDEIGPPDDDEMDVDVPSAPAKTGKRAVKWAETLESFHEGTNEPEMSMLSDELNVPEEPSAAPPASDTPSKPKPGKLRRLRTPRSTSSSTGNVRTETGAVAPPAPEAAKPAPRVTKRSSRIATPAKLPGAAKSLLPDGLMDTEEPASAPSVKKAPITRKKAPSSKLPAPASSLSAAAGKENSLIASPPKKRTTATTRASAVPKLDFKGKMDAHPVLEAPTLGIGASPAKKGRPAQVLFKESGEVSVTRDEVVGMGSPAKKRTRRGL
jgi:hypothetical protein